MFNFLRKRNPDLSALMAFWQFVKAANMDYNEFKSKIFFKASDEQKFRKIWDDIHYGKTKFDKLKTEFTEQNLDKNSKSIADYINQFIDILFEAQTGIKSKPIIDDVFDYNDILDWDDFNLEDTFDKLHDAIEEVPFITKTVKFDAEKNKQSTPHISITTIEQKVPGGPYTIKEYDSDHKVINEYTSKSFHTPLLYEWDKEDGTKQQKPGNLRT